MIKCSPEAFAKCKARCHHCGSEDVAYFLEGSDCDKFNKDVAATQKTNADRIRAMSDEELAEWMAECNAYMEHADASQWLPWLRMPAEGE